MEVVEVLLDSATRLGMASDSPCETTLSPHGKCTDLTSRGGSDREAKVRAWGAGTRLSVVLPYGTGSGVAGVSGMMTRPAEEKINDVRNHHRRVQIG